MQKFDVIIVGAGPAGLKCAETITKANNKLKVLVLEKNKEIGPKICAGGLTGKDLQVFNIPDELLDFRYNEVILRTRLDTTNVMSDEFFIYTIDRRNLGQWQLNNLKSTKAVVRTNSRVTKIEDNQVTVNDKTKYGYRYLVGADGASSIVRKHLNIPSEKIMIGIQYIVKTDDYRNLEIIFDDKKFNVGYGWIFPHRGYVSIGCGGDPKMINAAKLRENFEQWLKEAKIDVTTAEFQSFPINCDYRGYRFNNIFLVGDAAGFASEFTGEGMYQALISGDEVAKIILDSNYKPVKIEELLALKVRHNRRIEKLKSIGVFRPILYELAAILVKTRFFAKKLIDKAT